MEQQPTPLQELAALEAVVHNDHLPAEIRHMAAIRLAALHDQLATTPSPTVSPTRNAGQVALDASTVRGAVVGVNAGTLNVCFAGPATPPSSPWLTSYLETLLMTCDQLRLARLVGRRQTGAAAHTTPRLRLQDVYTQLTTDGPDQPVGRPRTRTLSQLRSLFERLQRHPYAPDTCDPRQVRIPVLTDPHNARVVYGYGTDAIQDVLTSPHAAETRTLQFYRPELALEAVAQHPRLVLLGDPGAGKSTLLRYLALLLARRLQGDAVTIPGWDAQTPVPIPVLCPLERLADLLVTCDGDADQALWQFLGTILDGPQSVRPGLRDELLHTVPPGGLVLFCDGLDEVSPLRTQDRQLAPRQAIIGALRRLALQTPRLRIVVTSRNKSYAATSEAHLPADEDWIVRTLQPFAFGQVQSFVTSWYQGIAQATDMLTYTEAQHQSQHLLAALRATPAVHPLVTSPLLLTMLTILHYNTNDITRDRAHLYHECVELLLERWEAVRHYDATTHPDQVRRSGPIPGLDLSLLRGMVHDLAFCAHDQPPQDDGRGRIARALLEGKLLHFFRRLHDPHPDRQVQRLCQVLEADAGLLQATDQEQYTLPHLTFQEYLAACYLVDQAGKPQQDLLTLAYDRWCGPYAEHWREALLLLIGRLRQQGPHALVRDGLPWLHLLLARRYQHAVKSAHQWQRDVLLATLSYTETGVATALAVSADDGQERFEQRLRTALVTCVGTPDAALTPVERVAITRALGELDDPRVPVTTPDWQHEADLIRAGAATGYWCAVPAGTYDVGGWDAPSSRPTRAVHHATAVALPAYWIARFPITVAQFAPFVEAGYDVAAKPWWTPHGWQWHHRIQRQWPWLWQHSHYRGSNQPVIGVTWYEATAFAAWLQHQIADHLPVGYRLRLPTEAEWEVAAAYTEDGHRRPYPWGTTAPTPDHVIDLTSTHDRPAPVGCCPQGAAACGALDMLGNVWEWTCSSYQQYPHASQHPVADFPQVATLPDARWEVPVRGGMAYFGHTALHSGIRDWMLPDLTHRGYTGFRLVLVPEVPPE